MEVTLYKPQVDLTALSGSVGWPASLAEAKKQPNWQAVVQAGLKTPAVKAYLAECEKAAQIMRDKIACDTSLDKVTAELAIITAFFASLVDTGVWDKVSEAKTAIAASVLQLPAVIKQNWTTLQPYVYLRNGTTLDCALLGWHRDGAIERPEMNPPPEYKMVDGKLLYQAENAKYYASLPPMVAGAAAAWPQFVDWVSLGDPKVRDILSALYKSGGVLNKMNQNTLALYPAVAEFLQKNVVAKFMQLMTAWKYGSPQQYSNYKADQQTYKKLTEQLTSQRQELADNFAVQMKQLPATLLQVPQGFLRDVAFDYGAACIAASEAQAHADAASELANRAGKTLEDSGKAVQDARNAGYKARPTSGGLDFGDESGGSSAANRAGAGFAAAHAAAKRAGANKRNGKAQEENDAARGLLKFATERGTNLGVIPPVDPDALGGQLNANDGKIQENAQTVIDQGDKLTEVLNTLTEINTGSLTDQIKHNSDVAETILNKPALPWWAFALAGLAILRR